MLSRIWLRAKARLGVAPIAILIEDGSARCVRGKVTRDVLADFSDIAAAAGIREGLITISATESGPVLRFSGTFTDAARQRFRNTWLAQPGQRAMRV